MGLTIIGPNAHEVQSADRVELIQPFMGMTEDEFKRLAESILVLCLHRPTEGIEGPIQDASLTWARLGTPYARMADEFSGFIEMTRAGMVRTFLQYTEDRPQVEYIVMMDNDEGVPWDAPYKLAQWGKEIVSGVVCSFSVRKGGRFACFTVKDQFGQSRFPSETHTRIIPAKGLIEVEHAGTGLLCVHKKVFRAILEAGEYPFLIPEAVRRHCAATGVLKLGEDMAFCEQAKRVGFKTYVDLSVRAEHFKRLSITWPKDFIDPDLDCRDWRVSAEDSTPTS